MPSLSAEYLAALSFSNRQLAAIRQLGEMCGRQQLFAQQAPAQLEALRLSATIESVESSNRLEGVTAGPGRVRLLVEAGARPKNRSEDEIAGYRDALQEIHSSHRHMRFTPNIILGMHGRLCRYLPNAGGRWKSAGNEIVERDADGRVVRIRFRATPAVLTPQSIDLLTSNYAHAVDKEAIEPLIAVPLATLDFLCVHPFHDGNGRMARLLTLLLLYRAAHEVGRYVSLERLIEETKETYYDALEASSRGWHDDSHDPHPWLNYFWGVLTRAYREFETRIEILKGSKTEQIRGAVARRVSTFGIADIERDCPGVSRDMIRHVLRLMRKEGTIDAIGRGRGARWCRLAAPAGRS